MNRDSMEDEKKPPQVTKKSYCGARSSDKTRRHQLLTLRKASTCDSLSNLQDVKTKTHAKTSRKPLSLPINKRN